MSNAPPPINRPFGVLLGSFATLVLTWALGSLLDELKETYGWTWTAAIKSVLTGLEPIVWSGVVIACVVALYWCIKIAQAPAVKVAFSMGAAEESGAESRAIVASPTALPIPPAHVDKDFLPPSITPESILGQLKGLTDAQVAKLPSPFLGKWVSREGVVDEVTPTFGDNRLLFLLREDGELDRVVRPEFGPNQTHNADRLHRGDRVRIVGRIHSVNRTYITLRDCEIA